jgi:hypothetical protein
MSQSIANREINSSDMLSDEFKSDRLLAEARTPPVTVFLFHVEQQ